MIKILKLGDKIPTESGDSMIGKCQVCNSELKCTRKECTSVANRVKCPVCGYQHVDMEKENG